jgi:23S rRNA (guanosine2251-2'-O)-methyltransferase
MRKLKTSELNRLDIEGFKSARKNPIIIVLDNIRSLNNIGSVFRTSDAFRIEKILLCGITGRPPHREIQKTAIGATASVEWNYYKDIKDAIQQLKGNGYLIIALEQTDESVKLNHFIPEPGKKYALVLGNEISGVSEAVVKSANFCVEIPQFGTKHSFNVTVSAGIAIWDILLKMNLLDKS